MKFEWDKKKAKTNLHKHKVSFEESATVFADKLALTFSDPDHLINEHRFLTFGITNNSKLLVVAHTENDDYIRIISARMMTKYERKIYEEY